jgi:hypothetical protein
MTEIGNHSHHSAVLIMKVESIINLPILEITEIHSIPE